MIDENPEDTAMRINDSVEIGLPRHEVLRLLAPLMRGAFQMQSRQHIQDFKAFAEQGLDVRSTGG